MSNTHVFPIKEREKRKRARCSTPGRTTLTTTLTTLTTTTTKMMTTTLTTTLTTLTTTGTNVARRRGRGRPSSFVGNLVVRDDDFDGERNRRRGRRRAGTSARRRGVGRRCGGSPRGASASSSKNDDDDDLYAILNLSPPYESLSKKDIKTAYRKRALETHPDRNKKPNATEEFNRCKQAYNTLSDDKLREEYDRKRRFWTKNGSDGRRRTASASSSAYTREPKTTEEPFYGFSDFFRDVEKEFEERERRKGRDPSKPKSLWEELEMLGEEFVEFLEENERNDFHNYDATETTTERMRAEAASKTSSNRNRNNGSSSSSSSRSSSSSSAEGFKTSNAGATTRKAKDESVEDMLRELKRKMGKE